MDRTRTTDPRGARRRRLAGLTLGAALLWGCHDLTLSDERVIGFEIPNAAPQVAVGDTVRLVARPLNAAGRVIPSLTVTWDTLDVGVLPIQLDPSGLVLGLAAGTSRVQARADELRSDPITVTVTP